MGSLQFWAGHPSDIKTEEYNLGLGVMLTPGVVDGEAQARDLPRELPVKNANSLKQGLPASLTF